MTEPERFTAIIGDPAVFNSLSEEVNGILDNIEHPDTKVFFHPIPGPSAARLPTGHTFGCLGFVFAMRTDCPNYTKGQPGDGNPNYATVDVWRVLPLFSAREGEVVKTAFEAITLLDAHEREEAFRYKGKAIYQPHRLPKVLEWGGQRHSVIDPTDPLPPGHVLAIDLATGRITPIAPE